MHSYYLVEIRQPVDSLVSGRKWFLKCLQPLLPGLALPAKAVETELQRWVVPEEAEGVELVAKVKNHEYWEQQE
jgi:hypothetical protein